MRTGILLLAFIFVSLYAWSAEDAENEKQAIVHLSMWYNFNTHHTLQALATRRFYDPGFGDMRQYLIDNEPNEIRQHGIYTGEVRYTWHVTDFKRQLRA